jgi:hypothetical protein
VAHTSLVILSKAKDLLFRTTADASVLPLAQDAVIFGRRNFAV